MIETAQQGRVLRVTLNRPEKRNALSVELCRALLSAIEPAAQDETIGAILLTANGPSFCAGMDLAELGTVNTDDVDRVHEQLFSLGARFVKPIVAAIQGPALGGGTGLAANCHVVVTSEAATFGLTEVRLALWPFLIYSPMVRAIGERRTLELALTGRIFGSPEAKEMGLVHHIAADPIGRATEIAETVASYSSSAIRTGIMYVQDLHDRGWKDAPDLARMLRRDIFDSDDFAEGVRAFREKRKPVWPSLRTQ